MKVNTEKLKDLVSKSIQGASNNKLVPLTQLMNISVVQGIIQLLTTNGTDYLYVSDVLEGNEDFYVTVYAEQFAKLVGKITSTDITMVVNRGVLEIKGNGDYALELPIDENGDIIKYPDPCKDIDTALEYAGYIKKSDIQMIVESVKPSLASANDDATAISNYFISDSVVATNRYKIACYNNKILETDKNILMTPQLMDLLSMADNDVNYYIADNYMFFSSPGIRVYSKYIDTVEEYPIDVLTNFISESTGSSCVVDKNTIVAVLDRIALFVGKYEERAVRLYFEKNGIRVSNKNRKSYEFIDYISSKDYVEYDCVINVDTFLSQIKAYPSESVEIQYNSENTIRLVHDDIVQIVALMGE